MSDELEIQISELAEAPLTIDIDAKSSELGLGNDDFTFLDPVTGRATLTLVRGKVIVKGVLKCRVKTLCIRCLNDFEFECRGTVHIVYEHDRRLLEPPAVGDPNEPDLCYFDGESIKPYDDFRQVLLVNLPDFPLCTSECKGLCPQCGKDLNKGECGCETQSPASEREKEGEDWKSKLRNLKSEM